MAEEKRSYSHFGGIIRLAVFLVVLIVLAFLLVRWAQDRQADRREDELNKDTSQVDSSEEQPATNDQSAEEPTDSSPSTTDEEAPVSTPGISVSPPSTTTLPSTGISGNLVLTATLLGIVIYLLGKNYSYHREIRHHI